MNVSTQTITNENQIQVFGIKRTGNHAIIEWLIDSFDGVVVHVNNIKTKRNLDPYQAFGRINIKGLPYIQCNPKNITGLLKHSFKRKKQISFDKKELPNLNIDYIRNFSDKKCLIYSYEDYYLDDSSISLSDEKMITYLGKSSNRYKMIILRDPFNLFASLLKSKMIDSENKDKYLALYKQYALEFINQTNLLEGNKVFVNYNDWFQENDYRQEIGNKLGLKTSGQPYEKIPNVFGGSSFNGLSYNQNAQEMKVLERWKYFQNDEFYLSIVKDKDLQELSQQIFGWVAHL